MHKARCRRFAALGVASCLLVGCGGGVTEPPSRAGTDDPASSEGGAEPPHVAPDAAIPARRDPAAHDAAIDVIAPDAAAAESMPDAGFKVTVYDLKTDWSDTKNPNGAWSLREGDHVIAAPVANWHGYKGQAAWCKAASGSGHIPVFLKISGAGFEAKQAQIGDLIVHAQDEFGGPGLGQAQIVWTAPASGTVDIKGGLWLGRTTLGRSDDWTLSVAGVQKAAGKVAANDGHDRNNPVPIAETNLPVSSGQTVVLQISRSAACANTHTCAEFCDLLLTITLTSP